MYKKKFISTADAAKIAGVTSQTIRNLCKAGTLSYQMRSNLFYPNREEVERYAATIADIHPVTEDIEQYKHQLETERDRLKNELMTMQAKYRERMLNLDMFPRRIEAIRDTLLAVMEGVNRYVDFADCCVTPRELNAVWDALQGKTFEEISDKFHVTPQSARLIWAKGLRKFAHVKAAFYHLNSQNDELRETLKEKNVEIANLKAQLNDKQIKVDEDTQNMSRLLAARLDNFGLSARTMNCMKYAEIDTLRDLLKHFRTDLLKYRNFGKKSLCELDELLEDHGLRWGMDVDLYPEYVPEVVA